MANKNTDSNTYNWESRVSIPLPFESIYNLTYHLDISDFTKPYSIFNNNVNLILSSTTTCLSLSSGANTISFQCDLAMLKDLSHSLKQAKLKIHGWS